MAKRTIEFKAAERGKDCRLIVDGLDISEETESVTIRAEAGCGTTVKIVTLNRDKTGKFHKNRHGEISRNIQVIKNADVVASGIGMVEDSDESETP